MGIDLTNPTATSRQRCRADPPFTLGVVDTSPLEMAEAYATFAARGQHCASRPVTAIEDSAGNLLKEYPAQCTQVLPTAAADAVNDILQGVTGARRVRPRTSRIAPAGRRQDRHHPGRQGRVVRRLHPEPRDRVDDRRRQPVRPADPARRADRRRRYISTPRPGPGSPARCGATRCRRSSSGCRDATFTPPNRSSSWASCSRCRAPPGCPIASAEATLREAGFTADRRDRQLNSALRLRHGRLHLPRLAAALPRRRSGHASTRRPAVPPPPKPRRRRRQRRRQRRRRRRRQRRRQRRRYGGGGGGRRRRTG